jgi:hypothetical protein
MSDEKNPTGSCPTGYGKPPRQTRFKKGQSGNPTGRPKGTPNLATALERALSEQVVINEGGQRRTVTKLEATVTQLVNKAMMGDHRAMQQLLAVVRVITNEPSEPRAPRLRLTEADQQITTRLIDRIRQSTPHQEGGAHDDTHR